MRSNTRPAFALLAAAAAVVLAGCGAGSDDDSGSSATSAPSTSAAATTTDGNDGGGGGGSSAAGSAAPADDVDPEAEGACTAFAPGQLEEILGAPAEMSGAGGSCEATAGEKSVEIDISAFPGGGYTDLDDFISSNEALTTSQVKVDGVGDAAFFSIASSELSIVAGEQYFDIQVTLSGTSADLDPTTDKSAEKSAAIPLAATALDRAPIDIDQRSLD